MLMSILYTWLVHRQPHTLIHSLLKYYRKVRTAVRAYVNIVHASLSYLSRDCRYHWHRQLKTKSRHRTLYWHCDCWKNADTWALKALLEVICIECTDNVRLTKSGVRLSFPPPLPFWTSSRAAQSKSLISLHPSPKPDYWRSKDRCNLISLKA